MGSQIGVAIAAIVMVGGPELLRNLGFLKAVFGEGFDPNEYRLLLFGLAMVADDDLAAARPDLGARALGGPEGAQVRSRARSCREGHG